MNNNVCTQKKGHFFVDISPVSVNATYPMFFETSNKRDGAMMMVRLQSKVAVAALTLLIPTAMTPDSKNQAKCCVSTRAR
jgi:hypothetical protein